MSGDKTAQGGLRKRRMVTANGKNKALAFFATAAILIAAAWLFLPSSDAGAAGRRHLPADEGAVAGLPPEKAGESVGDFPQSFAQFQTPSSRKTVVYRLELKEPASKELRSRASACGARVLGFMPPNSLSIEAGEDALRKLQASGMFAGAHEIKPGEKIQSRLREKMRAGKSESRNAQCATTGSESADCNVQRAQRNSESGNANYSVTVVPLAGEDIPSLKTFVCETGGTLIVTADKMAVVRANVAADAVTALSRRGDVRRIELFSHAKLHNNVAVRPGLMNVLPVREIYGLTGRGQNITTVDSGLDTGNINTLMEDFAGRIHQITTVSGALLCDSIGHGTHTAGSIVGTGALSGGEITGVAPGARMYVWQALMPEGNLRPPPIADLFQPDKANFPAYIASCSWGYCDWSAYTAQCHYYDEYVWNNPGNLGVFSAGNNGHVADPSGAKNVIAVGATENLRTDLPAGYLSFADNASEVCWYNGFQSGRGPMEDGRIKPDVCAPGTMILSTRTTCVSWDLQVGWLPYAANPYYTYNSGTSMSTALVAGSAALVREWLTDRRGMTNPSAALMKAILLGGAHDMSKDAFAYCGEGTAPNKVQGWGRIDAAESLFPSGGRIVKCADYIPFSQGSDRVVRVKTTNTANLDVQLAWIDYPADLVCAERRSLVNDLDLVVSNETTGVVWRGNGVAGGDRTNNVEGVRIKNAAPGRYAIHVVGVQVPYDSTEGGAAALYVRGAIEQFPATIIRFR